MIPVFARLKREWSINDVARVVRTHERFSMLNEGDAVALVQHMHPIRLSAGETLFREGRNDTNFMAVVLEGQALAETDGGGLGEKIELGVVGEGDLVGEQGILKETSRSATVTATTDMVLAAIDGDKFDRLTRSKPALGCAILISLLRTVTLRLSDANQRVYVLEDSNKKLRNDLSLEISSSKNRVELKEIPPMDFTNSMFEPPDKTK